MSLMMFLLAFFYNMEAYPNLPDREGVKTANK